MSPRLSDLASESTCDICGRSYPTLGGPPKPTVPEGTCVCGGAHLVCYYCIKLLDLPLEGRCPASGEVRTAAALMLPEEHPADQVRRELREKGLL